MSIRNINKSIVFLLLSISLLSCSKEGGLFSESSHEGEPIQFGATTYSKIATKLQYTDKCYYETPDGTTLTVKKERIDWSPEFDVVDIYCSGAQDLKEAEYKISSAKANGLYSEAVLEPYDSKKVLKWGKDTGSQTFNAIYPAPSIAGESTDILGGNSVLFEHGDDGYSTFTVYVPYVQTMEAVAYAEGQSHFLNKERMKYCYMIGGGSGTPGTDVDIRFMPIVTTFDVVLVNNTQKELAVTALSLLDVEDLMNTETSTAAQEVAGTASATYKFDGTSINVQSATVNDGLKCVKAVFNDDASEIKVPAGDSLKATLFGLPREYTAMALKVETSMGEKYFPLKQSIDGETSFITFNRFEKYNIKIELPEITEKEIPFATKNILYSYLCTHPEKKDDGTNCSYSIHRENWTSGDVKVYRNDVALTDAEIIELCASIEDLDAAQGLVYTENVASYDWYFISAYAMSFFSRAKKVSIVTSSNFLSADYTGLKSVEELTVSGNCAYVNISNCPKLKTINFMPAAQCKIVGISNMSSLENLYINANSVKTIDLEKCHEIKHVYMTAVNSQNSIIFKDYPDLEWVYVESYFTIKQVLVDKCPSLYYFNLASTKPVTTDDPIINRIEFTNCTNEKLTDVYVLGNAVQSYQSYPTITNGSTFSVEGSTYLKNVYLVTGDNPGGIIKGDDGNWTYSDVKFTVPDKPIATKTITSGYSSYTAPDWDTLSN